MKRPEYQVLKDGKVKATKYAWNTARAAMRDLVLDELQSGEAAELFSQDNKKDEHGLRFVEGTYIWHTTGGRTFVYQIKKVTE